MQVLGLTSRAVRVLVAASLLWPGPLAASGAEPTPGAAVTTGPLGLRLRSDRLVVKLAAEAASRARALPRNALPTGLTELDSVCRAYGIREGWRLTRKALAPHRDEELFRGIGLDRVYVLRLTEPDPQQVFELVRALSREPWVEYAEPVYVYELASTVPDDPLFPLQWGHENTGQTGGTVDADMDSTGAWRAGTGSPAALIAVLDTGVDIDHPDLVDNLVPGVDFTDSAEGIDDAFNHGTQVTGNAVARGNNGSGVAGMCWGCAAMQLKVFGSGGFLSLEEIVPAIVFGADAGADVLNMSFGGEGWSQAFIDAVDYALGLGTLSVAASGNSGVYEPFLPAAFPNVVAVAGTRHDDTRLGSFGDHAEIAAPTGVITTWPEGLYADFRGTSAAAPFAAGLAGLLRAIDPTLHVQELRQLLRLGAEDEVAAPAEDTPGWDPYLGYGRINAARSVALIDGRWLAFDRPHTVCAGTLHVDLKDPNAGGAPRVTLGGDRGGDTETVVLEPVTQAGYYRGPLALARAERPGQAAAGNGTLELVDGETVTASAGPLTATMIADCRKRVCLAEPPELLPQEGDCDEDGVLDPNETWSFEASFENDQTEALFQLAVGLEPSSPSVIVGPVQQRESVYPTERADGLSFTMRLATGAPALEAVELGFAISGSGWQAEPAECAAAGFPSGLTVATNEDAGGPDTWPAIPPGGLSASDAACPGVLELSWDAVPGAGEYRIYRSEVSCTDASSAEVPYADSSVASFTDGAAAAGVDYFYAVEGTEFGTGCVTERACVAESCPCVPPPDPTHLTVTRVGVDLILSWDDPGVPGLAWNVYRDGLPDPARWRGPLVSNVGDLDPGTPGIQFPDAAAGGAGGSFHYLVTSVNACGESPLIP